MKASTKIRRSVKAISPVISVLLMIAITVAASLIAYAWIMGYMGGTTTKVGKAILIQSMAKNATDGKLLVYVQNVGQGSVTISSVYVDDVLRSFTADPNFPDNKLPEGKTASLEIEYDVPDSGQVKVKVVTTEGPFTESTAISSSQGSSGSLNIIPTAAFSFSPTDPETGETVTFTDASTDSDGSVVAWAWTFGDSGTSTAQNPTHSYASANTYTVRLTVTDDDGATDYVEDVVPVGLPPGVLDHFDFDTINPQTTGVAFGITITAKDQYGATFSYSGSGTLSDLSGTISPTGVTFSAGVATSSVTITTARTADTITVDADGKTGTSDPFDVSNPPAVLDHFEFDTIGDQTVGQAFSITIRAIDQYGAAFTSYGGSGTLGDLSGTITPTGVSFSGGVATPSVTITTARTDDTITVNADGKSGTSNQFDVSNPPPVLDHFDFDSIGGQQATVAFDITITAKDQYGATFSFNGAGTLSDLSGTITPTGVSFTGGVANPTVTITTTYTGDTITVNAGGKSGTSNAFNVAAAPAVFDHFDFDTITSPKTSGTPFSITIRAKDQYDAAFTSYTGTNSLTYSAGAISPTTTTAFTAGVWTGDVTVTGSGTGVTISTAAQSDPTKTGTSNTFNVNSQQVTFVSAGTGSGSTNGNPTPGYPTGLQTNDLILLQVVIRGDDSPTITPPTGFALLYGPDATGGSGYSGDERVTQWIYYKFSTGSETGTGTVTITGTNFDRAARMYAFRNVALTSFTEGASFGYGDDDVILAQSVTTSGNGRLAVSFVSVENDISVGSFTGESNGDWTEAVSEFTFNGDDDICMQLQTATMASAGTISGGSYDTGSTSYRWGVRAFALKPA